jgi:hypothetical protein
MAVITGRHKTIKTLLMYNTELGTGVANFYGLKIRMTIHINRCTLIMISAPCWSGGRVGRSGRGRGVLFENSCLFAVTNSIK